MLTLNQIKERLVGWFENHGQINVVVWADDFEFNAHRNLTFPVVNIEFVDSSINNKFLTYNFKVVVGDVVSADDPELQTEVHSDCILILEDFFAYLQEAEGWVFSKSTSLQPFVDDMGDRVSGVVCRVSLSVIRSQNTCQTP